MCPSGAERGPTMTLWGSRFEGKTNALLRRFGDSFAFDRRLYAVDIRGSVAYAGALLTAGLLNNEEHAAIVEGLGKVLAEFDAGTFEPRESDEDIHTAVERRLTEIIGPAGGKLHTGRSRNDQAALDVRLWVLEATDEVATHLAAVQQALLDQAADHPGLIMPGYTHLQPAQPVPFAHWLLNHFWALERDQGRLADCARRTAVSPLGAGALAGNPYAIDREALAAELGMSGVTPNSLDAVSDRDFVVEFLAAGALIGTHISRLAEDLILYSSPGFGFVTIGESFTTGSSLMPQKRNPDSLELARGKSGRLTGNLVALLTALKGLPSAYNKDMQEDKAPLFDTADTLALLLPVVAGVVASLKPNPAAMQAALNDGMLATDLADVLVEHGMPFREAHSIVGRLVRQAEERGMSLSELPAEVYQAASEAFGENVAEVFDYARSVARRAVTGGTAPEALAAQIEQARAALAVHQGE